MKKAKKEEQKKENKHKQRLRKFVFWTNKYTLPPIGVTSTFTKWLLFSLASLLAQEKKQKILRKVNK